MKAAGRLWENDGVRERKRAKEVVPDAYEPSVLILRPSCSWHRAADPHLGRAFHGGRRSGAHTSAATFETNAKTGTNRGQAIDFHNKTCSMRPGMEYSFAQQSSCWQLGDFTRCRTDYTRDAANCIRVASRNRFCCNSGAATFRRELAVNHITLGESRPFIFPYMNVPPSSMRFSIAMRGAQVQEIQRPLTGAIFRRWAGDRFQIETAIWPCATRSLDILDSVRGKQVVSVLRSYPPHHQMDIEPAARGRHPTKFQRSSPWLSENNASGRGCYRGAWQPLAVASTTRRVRGQRNDE